MRVLFKREMAGLIMALALVFSYNAHSTTPQTQRPACGPGSGQTPGHLIRPRQSRNPDETGRTFGLFYGGIYEGETTQNFVGFWNFVSASYKLLLDSGVPKDHLKVLWGGGPGNPGRLHRFRNIARTRALKNPLSGIRYTSNDTYVASEDFDCDGQSDIAAEATGSRLRSEISALSGQLHEGDKLLVFLTGHGSGSTIAGYGGRVNRIHRDELQNALDELPSGVKVGVIIESCHSGGFLRLHRRDRCVVASSREDEISWGSYVSYGFFAQTFLSSAWGADLHSGRPIDADFNHDGRTSLREAFLASEFFEARRPRTPGHDGRVRTQTPVVSTRTFGNFMEQPASRALIRQTIERLDAAQPNVQTDRDAYSVDDDGNWQMRRGGGLVRDTLSQTLQHVTSACDDIVL